MSSVLRAVAALSILASAVHSAAAAGPHAMSWTVDGIGAAKPSCSHRPQRRNPAARHCSSFSTATAATCVVRPAA